MLKLITTTAVLVALTAPAMAGAIPTKFTGDWCAVKNIDSLVIYDRKKCTSNFSKLTVKANQLAWWESDCAIKTTTQGTTGWRAKYSCSGEGRTWDEVIELQLVGLRLIVRTISTTNEHSEVE